MIDSVAYRVYSIEEDFFEIVSDWGNLIQKDHFDVDAIVLQVDLFDIKDKYIDSIVKRNVSLWSTL